MPTKRHDAGNKNCIIFVVRFVGVSLAFRFVFFLILVVLFVSALALKQTLIVNCNLDKFGLCQPLSIPHFRRHCSVEIIPQPFLAGVWWVNDIYKCCTFMPRETYHINFGLCATVSFLRYTVPGKGWDGKWKGYCRGHYYSILKVFRQSLLPFALWPQPQENFDFVMAKNEVKTRL